MRARIEQLEAKLAEAEAELHAARASAVKTDGAPTPAGETDSMRALMDEAYRAREQRVADKLAEERRAAKVWGQPWQIVGAFIAFLVCVPLCMAAFYKFWGAAGAAAVGLLTVLPLAIAVDVKWRQAARRRAAGSIVASAAAAEASRLSEPVKFILALIMVLPFVIAAVYEECAAAPRAQPPPSAVAAEASPPPGANGADVSPEPWP